MDFVVFLSNPPVFVYLFLLGYAWLLYKLFAIIEEDDTLDEY